MTRLHIRRCACHWDGVRSCSSCGRLAGGTLDLGGCDLHELPTATGGPARRNRSPELIESDRPPLGRLHSLWRIRTRGITVFVMIDRAFVARLWKGIRAAVHEFKISRMQKRSDKRFWVVEVSKCDERRRHFSFSGCCRAPLSARCVRLKRSARRRARQAAVVVACPKVHRKNENAGWALISSTSLRRSEDREGGNDTEEDSVTSESAPINWTDWKEVEIGEFSTRFEIAAISSSKSMEDLGSLKWDESLLTPSASTKSANTLGEISSAADTSTGFEHRRWENRYRVSNKSPQLMQPVRGKLTTLSSLLRTVSDRYARRTGKLTPLHDKSKSKSNSKSNNNHNKRPVLTQSQSAAASTMPPQQQQQNYHRSTSTAGVVNEVPGKRFDNPFQDFLRQSFAERHSRSVHETDRQR